jgi:hypothetical protein
MKTKLIHRGNGNYRLYVNEIPYATTDNSPYKKLSKQNCNEIFGLCDVERLTNETFTETNPSLKEYEEGLHIGFKIGFNKAMELNNNKKFTEEDMIKFADAVYKLRKENQVFEKISELLQSLQQPTEIEVEVEMDEPHQYEMCSNPKDHNSCLTPKLDLSGCLILKKL